MRAALLTPVLLLAAACPANALLVSLDPGAPISETTGQIYLNASYIKASGARYARVNFILGRWTSPSDTTRRGPGNLTWKETCDEIINNLRAQGVEDLSGIRLALVTSASHMPRAMRHFEQVGLKPVAAPTHFMSFTDNPAHLSYWLPSATHLRKSERACYEFLASLVVKAEH